jgi:hypothetical protein
MEDTSISELTFNNYVKIQLGSLRSRAVISHTASIAKFERREGRTLDRVRGGQADHPDTDCGDVPLQFRPSPPGGLQADS